MQLTSEELDDYVANLARVAERYGVTLDLPDGAVVFIDIEQHGTRRFEIAGSLPDERLPRGAVVEISEKWLPAGKSFERSAYRYELIDHQRGYRRAFHRHDEANFERGFGVVVHEHCEAPVGDARCPHYFGPPVRDGYRAIGILIAIWVDAPPNCADLPCLEPL